MTTVNAEEIAAVPGTVREWFGPIVDPDRRTQVTVPGPWQDEPNKVQWVDAATQLPCLIVRGPLGALCGYAGVAPGHPLHGVDYSAAEVDLQVHGGITFADRCQPTTDHSKGICHIPEPGTSDDVWWFGFDCAHYWDVVPGMIDLRLGLGLPELERGEYRDVSYVAMQVRMLASQLAVCGTSYCS